MRPHTMEIYWGVPTKTEAFRANQLGVMTTLKVLPWSWTEPSTIALSGKRSTWFRGTVAKFSEQNTEATVLANQSAGGSFCSVLRGESRMAYLHSVHDWAFCAGHAIVAAAGGQLCIAGQRDAPKYNGKTMKSGQKLTVASLPIVEEEDESDSETEDDLLGEEDYGAEEKAGNDDYPPESYNEPVMDDLPKTATLARAESDPSRLVLPSNSPLPSENSSNSLVSPTSGLDGKDSGMRDNSPSPEIILDYKGGPDPEPEVVVVESAKPQSTTDAAPAPDDDTLSVEPLEESDESPRKGSPSVEEKPRVRQTNSSGSSDIKPSATHKQLVDLYLWTMSTSFQKRVVDIIDKQISSWVQNGTGGGNPPGGGGSEKSDRGGGGGGGVMEVDETLLSRAAIRRSSHPTH